VRTTRQSDVLDPSIAACESAIAQLTRFRAALTGHAALADGQRDTNRAIARAKGEVSKLTGECVALRFVRDAESADSEEHAAHNELLAAKETECKAAEQKCRALQSDGAVRRARAALRSFCERFA
jgi:hypothetical protein